jgi:ketosteroid isomerase-like protein
MSQENVELARRTWDAFNRRDRDAWLATRHPDSEVVPAGAWPEADVIRGPEAIWDFYVAILDAFDAFPANELELVDAGGQVELVDAGPEGVLVHHRHALRGKTSGADVEFEYWNVVTLREGKILRDHWFADQDEALEAAGLRE